MARERNGAVRPDIGAAGGRGLTLCKARVEAVLVGAEELEAWWVWGWQGVYLETVRMLGR
ncbi:MAG: hypothetical protein KY468_15200 [Armatimonadetes bacterium]|nr:hypothetical protein [Armatimonadota bacterium]